MIAKLGPIVTEAAGSIGGSTFQRNPYGTIIRSKPLPIRRTSAYNTSARQRTKTLTYLWRTLSNKARSDWDLFAATQTWYNRFGDVVNGSGYLAFLKNNMAVMTSAVGSYTPAIQTAYPGVTASIIPDTPNVFLDKATDELYFDSPDGITDSDTILYLFGSPPLSVGTSAYFGPWSFITSIAAGSAVPYYFDTEYTTVFGGVPQWAKYQSAFIRIQAHNASSFWPGLDTTLKLILI